MNSIIGNDTTYGLLKSALDASDLRQKAISNNISNINTPNYKANRVVFEEELKKATSDTHVGLKATHKGHIGIDAKNEMVQPKMIKDQSASMRNDGNNIDIDLEMANVAANQLRYNALIQQTNGKISTLRYAIHEGRK